MAEFAQQLLTSHPDEASRAFVPLVSLLTEPARRGGGRRRHPAGPPTRAHRGCRAPGDHVQRVRHDDQSARPAASRARRRRSQLWDLVFHGIAPPEWRHQSKKRQMSLVGFMQAGNVTVYAGSWRHPATEHGFLDAGLLPEARPHPRGRLLRPDVLRRPPGHARHLRRFGGRGGATRRPPGEARPEHRARGRRRRHAAHRPRRDVLDDVLLAVPRRPDLRHPRPPLRRPGRVERRHVGERQRGAELRREASTSATTPATTAPTSSSRRPPGCGTPGTTTRSCSTARAARSPIPTRCTSSSYEGEWFQRPRPAHRAALAAGPARAAAGGLVGPRAATSRRAGPS